jgi:DNA-binding response OmpR family regulator
MARKGRLLLVDDDRVTLAMLEHQLSQKGHQVKVAENGEEGLQKLHLHADEIDTVLLDRRMPGLDGIGVVQRMQQSDLRHIPAIMLTGADSVAEMREGIDAGVFYYLCKPVDIAVLDSVLEAALRQSAQHRQLQAAYQQQQNAYHLLDSARFRYRTLAEAESLAGLLACCFPEPERVLSGLAELLFNAVEHGSLAIGYTEKTRLLGAGLYEDEIAHRMHQPEYTGRSVDVVLQRKIDGVYVQITDEGGGFAWQNYLNIDPSRATHNHGRGIAQANAQAFDGLKYNAKGNQVLAMVAHEPPSGQILNW